MCIILFVCLVDAHIKDKHDVLVTIVQVPFTSPFGDPDYSDRIVR